MLGKKVRAWSEPARVHQLMVPCPVHRLHAVAPPLMAGAVGISSVAVPAATVSSRPSDAFPGRSQAWRPEAMTGGGVGMYLFKTSAHIIGVS